MDSMTRGALARAADVNTETIRYYERRGLLPEPSRTPSGYRLYAAEDATRLRFIKRAQELGFTLAEIEVLLSLRADPGASRAQVRQQAREKATEVAAKIRDLERIKKTLEELIDACDGEGSLHGCPILHALEGEAA